MEKQKRLYEIEYANTAAYMPKRQFGYSLVKAGVWATDAEEAIKKLRDSGETVAYIESVQDYSDFVKIIV